MRMAVGVVGLMGLAGCLSDPEVTEGALAMVNESDKVLVWVAVAPRPHDPWFSDAGQQVMWGIAPGEQVTVKLAPGLWNITAYPDQTGCRLLACGVAQWRDREVRARQVLVLRY